VNPGGSSSGSATAVAARLATSSIGTQTGGSVTVPSLAQGLTGLKPTMGRISLRGVIPLTYTRDHVGPLARDARDAALLLQAMAGPDPEDPRTLGLPPVPDYLAAVSPRPGRGSGLLHWDTRIGIPPGWAEADGEEGGLRRAFLREMEASGADLMQVDPGERWRELSSGDMNSVRLPERSEPFLEWLREDVRLFGVSLSSWIQGLLLSGDEYVKGQRARHALLRLTLDRIFSACDVMLLESHLAFDQTGLPLLALPVGFTTEEGGRSHPRGVLLGGAPFGEERLLALAHTWQERTEHHRRRPDDPAPSDEARYRRPGGMGRGRLDVEAVAELSQ
jgi:Asp-tRNA(Asn)/Glu-tRNA(Gln) amidotransferase A subunit family amidase